LENLRHLFQPLKIGSMEVQNRIVMSGMDPGFGIDDDGCVTDQLIEYLVERARSRPGMIITGAKPVHPLGTADPNTIKMVPLWEERVLPSLERMVKAVHQYDVKFGAQLNHAGLAHLPQESVCPSAIPELTGMGLPIREATKDDLREYVQAFAVAAERCVKVGFDFVEIHGGHGYLINTFLTPFYNRRTDEYGGSFENRIRFLLEIIGAIRRSVGSKVPIGVRVNGDDFIGQGSWNLTELSRLAPILEKETVDYVSITAGASTMGTLHYTVMPMYQDQGVFSHFSEEIKKHVSIPVSIVGRIKDPVMADRLIAEKKADLVVMARAQIADPEMVEKARNGDMADIRLCLGDCLGCIEGILRHGEATCTVNPRLGREYLIREGEGEKKAAARRVLVAGAGPAGLEAARRAAFAGHKVTLCESRGWMGGQVKLAATMPKRSEIGDIIPWYERQLNRLGVEIRLNVNVDAELLDQIRPDVLVIATGSLPEVPLGFVDGLSHIRDIEVLMVDELLEDKRLTGEAVLIVGGDQIGLQVADYLAERGKAVAVVEKAAHFGEKLANADRRFLMGRLIDKGVRRYKNVEKVDIQPTDDVWMVCGGKSERLPGIDTIVLANERRPNIFLAEVAEKKGIEVHIVGDASGVAGEGQGTIMAAIATGYDIGRRI
jgi:2,4-dienoyl-CoA reductase-like NADH-dependent reductase (Old Yellow Enzyme family)/NADPH-dependent 2,4-dienoyl-CoA reductase/sulfur reductase-like enzyme